MIERTYRFTDETVDRQMYHDLIRHQIDGIEGWRDVDRRVSSTRVRIRLPDDHPSQDEIAAAVDEIDGLKMDSGWTDV